MTECRELKIIESRINPIRTLNIPLYTIHIIDETANEYYL